LKKKYKMGFLEGSGVPVLYCIWDAWFLKVNMLSCPGDKAARVCGR
jgi:hypothetical protein